MNRMVRRGLVVGAASLAAVLGFATVAQAHVTVNPNQADQGGFTRIAFRVPTESDTASTTKLDVFLPTDQPIASVSLMPVPGWTGTTVMTKLAKPITNDDGDQVTQAISQITWTANSSDTAIKPGQFQEFPVSLGPLPKTDSLTFKTLQTYSDGTVVRWIDVAAPGQAEPEHPAPVLKLAPASVSSAAPAGSTVPEAGSGSDNSSDTAALTVGIIGGILGLLGIVMGGLALVRTRRTG
jgi:uncharacterized protein YcnI